MWGPSSRNRRLTEVASCPSGGWFTGEFFTGKLKKPASLLRNDTVRHPQIFGDQLERRTKKVVGQGDRIGHGQNREPVQHPGPVEQVGGVGGRKAVAAHVAEGHQGLAGGSAGHNGNALRSQRPDRSHQMVGVRCGDEDCRHHWELIDRRAMVRSCHAANVTRRHRPNPGRARAGTGSRTLPGCGRRRRQHGRLRPVRIVAGAG